MRCSVILITDKSILKKIDIFNFLLVTALCSIDNRSYFPYNGKHYLERKKSMLKYCSLLIDSHTLDLSTSDGVLVGAFIEHVCTEGDILRSVTQFSNSYR